MNQPIRSTPCLGLMAGAILLTGIALRSEASQPHDASFPSTIVVRLRESRGEWFAKDGAKLGPASTTGSHGPCVIPSGRTVHFEFISDDYVYILSQPELDLELVVIPGQVSATTVSSQQAGAYPVNAMGLCGDLWSHRTPPLRLVCRP
jgi:heme/copper-type cytochrome/quinol oxidase subunit 2